MKSFTDGRIEGEIKDALDKEVAACNSEGGLRIQLVTDEPEAFGGFMSRHSDFSNVRNYIALVGADNTESREKLGYYGERLVILAQRLGLNSCWVALTFSKRKSKVEVGPGEALVCAIALGYGTTQGSRIRSRGRTRSPNAGPAYRSGSQKEWNALFWHLPRL